MPAAGQFPLALMVLTLGASALLAGPAAAEIVKISVADLSRADLTDAKNLNQSRLDQACGMDGDKANSIAHYKDAANVAAAVGRMSRRLLISGHDHLVAMLNRLKLRDQLDSLIDEADRRELTIRGLVDKTGLPGGVPRPGGCTIRSHLAGIAGRITCIGADGGFRLAPQCRRRAATRLSLPTKRRM